MYSITTENFLLKLNPEVIQEDISYPVNTQLHVTVSSSGFSVKEAVMEIDVKALAAFACALNALYETLTGTAELREPYGGQSFIRFSADRGGHIEVKGKIRGSDSDGHNQTLEFQNGFDQTYLKTFAKQLLADYKSYLKYKEAHQQCQK